MRPTRSTSASPEAAAATSAAEGRHLGRSRTTAAPAASAIEERMMNSLKTLMLALCLGTCAAPALAADNAGTATLVTGHVSAAAPSGEIRDLIKGGTVYAGEVIITAVGSYVNIE